MRCIVRLIEILLLATTISYALYNIAVSNDSFLFPMQIVLDDNVDKLHLSILQ